MENKIIIGFIVIASMLIAAIGVMTFILITREPIVTEVVVEEALEAEIVEPPPLEEDALLAVTKVVADRLRVFDVEERQDVILSAIESALSPGMSTEAKKAVIESVVDTELTAWKDTVIRDTLLEMHGEYASEDYETIDRKTNIKQLKEFVTRFEMEVLGIE